MRPRLAIFDCDGVLVDSEQLSNLVLAQMIGEQGREMTLAQARARFQGMLLADIPPLVEADVGAPLPESWLDDYQRRRSALFRSELRAVAGSQALVQSVVDAGMPVCVASQAALAKTSLSLSLTGLDHLFPEHARFSAEDVARGKPHPDVFLHAAATMGVAPADCVVVEDSPSGVTAGVRAGMRVYGLAADSDEHALRAAGAHVVAGLEEVGPLLLAGVHRTG